MTQPPISAEQEWQRRMDEVVNRLASTRRTFTEEEAFAPHWAAGYELIPTEDPRFEKVAPAGPGRREHWRLNSHLVANNRLLDALTAGEWDGADLDSQLARLDHEEGGHHVFCSVDPRFAQGTDGRWEPSDGERDSPLSEGMRAALDALAPRLQALWREQGSEPWTIRRVQAELEALGWSGAVDRGAWLRLRTWLKDWSEVIRVGRDYWVPADGIPTANRNSRLQVLPIRPSNEIASPAPRPPAVPNTGAPADPGDSVPVSKLLLIPSQDTGAGMEATWTTTLRTVHLLEGFIPVPPQARGVYPPRAPGASSWQSLRGKWFDTDEDLWLWLNREEDRLSGPQLADKLAWCEAGERLRIHWAPDVVVFRPSGIDAAVQEEERRLVDRDALAGLRAGLGESYRRSLLAILSEEPAGMAFRELVTAVRERQGHEVHRGTVRAVLSAGGFVKRDGRWLAPADPAEGALRLRQALVGTLIWATSTAGPAADDPRRLKDVAHAVGERLREINERLSCSSKRP